ncbi:MAG: diaminopimelate epimerase [Planctomycetia bacterium]
MRYPYTLCSGAGNRFVAIDLFQHPAPVRAPELARRLCSAPDAGGLDARPDGLLLVARPTRGGAAAMILYNADGSRAETCGNGLRCLAKLVSDRQHVRAEQFVLEADAGLCPTTVQRHEGLVTHARIAMGAPRGPLRRERIRLKDGSEVEAVLVDMGNPHCVLFVSDERTAPVTTLGAELERHLRFARGTNVEFLALRDAEAHLRVFERGVGETAACGSGACAAAIAAAWSGRARLPLKLQLPGGELVISQDACGGLELFGPAQIDGEGWIDWPES